MIERVLIGFAVAAWFVLAAVSLSDLRTRDCPAGFRIGDTIKMYGC